MVYPHEYAVQSSKLLAFHFMTVDISGFGLSDSLLSDL